MSRHDARERDSWRRQISAYIVNELKPALRPAIERELRACRECRSYYEQEQALHDRRRGLDSVTPPQGLRRDVFAKIEREKAAWLPAGLQLPSLGAVVTVVTLIALAFLVPQIFQLVRSGQFEQQALPPRLLVQADVSPLPTVAVQPAALDTRSATAGASLPPLPTAQVRPLVAVGGPGLTTGAAATGSTGSSAVPTPAASASPLPTAVPAVTPATTVLEVQVSGRVTEVRRAQRLATVREGPTTVTVAFSADTVINSDPDGQALTYEQIGIADRVRVTGVRGNAPDTVTALRVSVLNPLFHAQATPVQSSVTHPRGRAARVLYLQDGIDGAPSDGGEQASTRQWLDRLTADGFNVVPINPARVTALSLGDVGLVVIGFPATLSRATLGSIQNSAVPVLNANPLYVSALGLGEHPDPANPGYSVPSVAVQVVPGVALVQDLVGTQAVAVTPLERVPIVAQGTVLAALDERGRERAVWTINGSRMYFGIWPDSAGGAPTALYWTFLNRAVTQLLGA